MLTIGGAVGVMLAAEVAIRVRWAVQHHDPAYLVIGLVNIKAKSAPRPVGQQVTKYQARQTAPAVAAAPTVGQQAAKPPVGAVAMPTINGSKQWNPCAQREISFRTNSTGGRGPEWAIRKAPGSVRVLAMGESSTYGAANDEDQTWPAILERQLRERGVAAEVLNFGVPGQRIDGMLSALPNLLETYHPDLIVHYGGFNETWDAPEVPQVFSSLNYRSMLYTYIYEKLYFRAEASAKAFLPDTKTYEARVTTMIETAQKHGVKLMMVSQAVSGGNDARTGRECAARWRDSAALSSCVSQVMAQADERYPRLVRIRMIKTMILEQVLADVAAKFSVPVIDPRETLVERDENHLFCDEIHLTDKGNSTLVSTIVSPILGVLSGAPGR